MATARALWTTILVFVSISWASGQNVASTPPSSPAQSPSETVALTVPRGATLQVALGSEVRVKRVGQPIHGLMVEPVYAFDQEVVPVGSEVAGRITGIERVSRKRRILAAANAEFTPTHRIHVQFDEIILADGRHMPVNTVVTPGSGLPIQLVTTVDQGKRKTPKDAASKKMKEAIQETKRKWRAAMKQIKEPGKLHRLARFAVAQLPVHPQYMNAGTVYFAELKEPLDFGSKPLPLQTVASIATSPPPCRALTHAQLVTPLNSATTKKGDAVEASLSQPLFSGDRLIFPQGSLLKGTVVQVQPARRLGRNGKLQFVFHELVPPDGIQQKVDAFLEGVQTSKNQRVQLDPEGEAQATAPRKRYFSTGLAVALAFTSYEDSGADDAAGSAGGSAGQGAAGGAAGFRLIGIAVGTFARSRPLSLGMGIYGAARTAYSSFLARGRDVAFPKGTAMEIGFRLARDCDSSEPDATGKTNQN